MTNLRLVTTFENYKMKCDVNRFRIGEASTGPETILKQANASAGIGVINVNDAIHRKYATTTKGILESIATIDMFEDCVVPLPIDTLSVELPEAGSVKGWHNVKPLQEVAATKVPIELKEFKTVKDVLLIVTPEEAQGMTSEFKQRYNVLSTVEAGKEMTRIKQETIQENIKLASESLTATATQRWNSDTTNPFSVIFAGRKKIKKAECGSADMLMCNSETWSNYFNHAKVNGKAFGVQNPDFDTTFQVPGVARLKGKVNDEMTDGTALLFNSSWFMLGLQSYAYLEQATDITIGADIMRFVNFQNTPIWHQKAGVVINGLLA